MGFIDDMLELQKHATEQVKAIKNESATKTALVQPFLEALGYNIKNIKEVAPEYAVEYADVRNELIDYAILQDEQPIILIECKPCTEDLKKKHVAQLINYFPKIKGSKFGILTNGIVYKFYTDIENVNLLDEDPFLELDILNMKIPDINDIEMFSKPIDKYAAYEKAKALKRVREIRNLLESEFEKPSKEFIEYIANKIIKDKNIGRTIRKQFCVYTKEACTKFIQDKIEQSITGQEPLVPPEPPESPAKYFYLNGVKQEVKFWKDMLPIVCVDMEKSHKGIFDEKIFAIKGSSNVYFSRIQAELKSPEQIEGTDIYVETSFAKNMLLDVAKKVVSLFGHPDDYVSYVPRERVNNYFYPSSEITNRV